MVSELTSDRIIADAGAYADLLPAGRLYETSL